MKSFTIFFAFCLQLGIGIRHVAAKAPCAKPKPPGKPSSFRSSTRQLATATVFSTSPTVDSLTTAYPVYSTFPIGSIPCASPTAFSSFSSAQADSVILNICIGPNETLEAGRKTAYSAVASGVTAAVSLVPSSPSCKPGPISLDAERCLSAFWSIQGKCPAYGGGFIFDAYLGCLKFTLTAPN